jgi:hypothetical protein
MLERLLTVWYSTLDRVKRALLSGRGLWNDHLRQRWLEVWNGVKGARVQILAGLLVGAILSAAGYWVWSTWEAWRVKELASVVKTWPTSKIVDNASVEVTTRCAGSGLSFTVVIIPPSEAGLTLWERTDEGRLVTERIRKRLRALHLQFVYRDGSPAAAYDLPMDGFVRIYSDNKDSPTRLEYRGTHTCSAGSYVRAQTLKLTWIERRG